jgi:hypothetical protein
MVKTTDELLALIDEKFQVHNTSQQDTMAVKECFLGLVALLQKTKAIEAATEHVVVDTGSKVGIGI